MNVTAIQHFITDLFRNPLVIILPFGIFAWVLMLLSGNSLIRWLKSLKGMKWSPREDTPDSHLQKAGTPSMGGIGILGAATLSWIAAFTLLFSLSYFASPGSSSGPRAWEWVALSLFMTCVMAHGVLGFVDDWSKARGKGGLTSKAKLAGQCGLALVFLLAVIKLVPLLARSTASSNYDSYLQMDWRTALVCGLLLIGTSNAVNLTDGIDGLAAGLSVQIGIVFGILAGESFHGPTGLFAPSAQLGWLTLGGACLGFLAFNKNPARVFMGDTGSLALGAALGAGAILTRSVFLLPFIGFMFYIETLSVMSQVAYFKYTKKKTGEGKRIFRRAPLHHHFELGGWSEWRVVGTFWAINALTTILGLILWKTGILPRFP
ncbi:phospho-N-acetylmuramoyl-pentapeptide-transferase [Abditibacteriota bacterium]|nr:phospho-N-acetylmuramoyl-pentapeptide-transferase [Abditibacteriota bacterium]